MDRIRKIADNFFVEQDIKTLPIELDTVIDILEKRGWRVHLYSESEEFIREKRLEKIRYTKKAFAMNADGIKAIFYDDELGVLEKISALCHELAHDVIGHTGREPVGKAKTHEEITHEKEANTFSLEFQAPAFKLYQMGIDSVDKIVHAGILSKIDAIKQYAYYLQYIEDNELHPQKEKKHFDLNCENASTKKTINCENVYQKRKKKTLIVCFAIIACIGCGIFVWKSIDNRIQNAYKQENQHGIAAATEPPAATPVLTGSAVEIRGISYNLDMPVYHVQSNTEVFHKPDCPYITGKENLTQQTIEDALSDDLRPCSRCFK